MNSPATPANSAGIPNIRLAAEKCSAPTPARPPPASPPSAMPTASAVVLRLVSTEVK